MQKHITVRSSLVACLLCSLGLLAYSVVAQDTPAVAGAPEVEQLAPTPVVPASGQPVAVKKDYGIVVQPPADKAVRIERSETGDIVIAYEDQPVQIKANAGGGMISLDLFKLKQFRERPVASTAVALSYAAAGYGVYQYGDKQGWWGSDNDDAPAAPPAPQTVNGDYYYISGEDHVSFVQSINYGEGETVSASSSSQGGE